MRAMAQIKALEVPLDRETDGAAQARTGMLRAHRRTVTGFRAPGNLGNFPTPLPLYKQQLDRPCKGPRSKDLDVISSARTNMHPRCAILRIRISTGGREWDHAAHDENQGKRQYGRVRALQPRTGEHHGSGSRRTGSRSARRDRQRAGAQRPCCTQQSRLPRSARRHRHQPDFHAARRQDFAAGIDHPDADPRFSDRRRRERSRGRRWRRAAHRDDLQRDRSVVVCARGRHGRSRRARWRTSGACRRRQGRPGRDLWALEGTRRLPASDRPSRSVAPGSRLHHRRRRLRHGPQ